MHVEKRQPARMISRHGLLWYVALLMMFPFLWMVLASFKTNPEIEGTRFWPESFSLLVHPWQYSPAENWTHLKHLFFNYYDVFHTPRVSFARYYFNSLFVAAWVTFLTCF